MKTATKTTKPIDEVEAKRKELRRLERRLKAVHSDYRIYSGMVDEVREQLREANKLVKAEPDAVGQVIRGAMALCKHFPKASSATLYIHQDRTDGRYVACAQIPISIPERPAEGEKGGGA